MIYLRAWNRLVPTIALTIAGSAIISHALVAQDTTRAAPPMSPDSLAERLRRAEEAIELLKEQMATQAESQVQSASRVRVDLFGRVLVNGFFNSDSVNTSFNGSFNRDSMLLRMSLRSVIAPPPEGSSPSRP